MEGLQHARLRGGASFLSSAARHVRQTHGRRRCVPSSVHCAIHSIGRAAMPRGASIRVCACVRLLFVRECWLLYQCVWSCSSSPLGTAMHQLAHRVTWTFIGLRPPTPALLSIRKQPIRDSLQTQATHIMPRAKGIPLMGPVQVRDRSTLCTCIRVSQLYALTTCSTTSKRLSGMLYNECSFFGEGTCLLLPNRGDRNTGLDSQKTLVLLAAS